MRSGSVHESPARRGRLKHSEKSGSVESHKTKPAAKIAAGGGQSGLKPQVAEGRLRTAKKRQRPPQPPPHQ